MRRPREGRLGSGRAGAESSAADLGSTVFTESTDFRSSSRALDNDWGSPPGKKMVPQPPQIMSGVHGCHQMPQQGVNTCPAFSRELMDPVSSPSCSCQNGLLFLPRTFRFTSVGKSLSFFPIAPMKLLYVRIFNSPNSGINCSLFSENFHFWILLENICKKNSKS